MTATAGSAGALVDGVVLGVDDGPVRPAVLDAAAVEARLRDSSLEIVHVRGGPTPGPDRADTPARAAEHLGRSAPDVTVRTSSLPGDPAAVLTGRCGPTSLLVVGRRRRRGAEAGRTTEQLIRDAPCPVLVLPGTVSTNDGVVPRSVVVAGVDDSAGGRLVLDHALAVARRRGLGVVAVRTWNQVRVGPGGDLGLLSAEEEQEAQERTRAALEELVHDRTTGPGGTPDVAVILVVGPDRPARRLLAEARGADLVVLAHRGGGPAPSLGAVTLGSTVRAVLEGASCPVAVLGPGVVAAAHS